MKMTREAQVDAWRADLIADAECAERQASEGPFYPGVTAESLLKYAAECRAKAGNAESSLKDALKGTRR